MHAAITCNTSREGTSLDTSYTRIRMKHQRAYELSLNSNALPYSLRVRDLAFVERLPETKNINGQIKFFF